jgi:hypothetical protein
VLILSNPRSHVLDDACAQIIGVPMAQLDTIQEWLTDLSITFTAGPMNLNWKNLIPTITEDDRFWDDVGVRARARARVCANAGVRVLLYACARACGRARVCVCSYVRACVRARLCARVRACATHRRRRYHRITESPSRRGGSS